jgi:hydroxylysine kinase
MAADVDDLLATMVAPARPVAIGPALALVRERYGIECEATRLTGERDENFRLITAGGAGYVLKIANPAESPAETDFQTAALLHIEEADPELPCPRVLRDREGAAYVRFIDDSGAERTARIVTYLPGKLLGAARRSQLQRAACGRIGARLALALRGFTHPAAERKVVWDLRHTGRMRALLDELPRFPFRPAAATLIESLATRIDSELPRLRHQVVHNDLNPLNILVDPADESHVVGVIDFGDMTRTALIADVAVTAAELIPPDCTDPSAARGAVLDVASAYHERVPLVGAEQALLGALTAARLVMTVVIHEWHVARNPASGHFQALAEDFMGTRLAIATRLPLEEFGL